jgi:outer membrane protein assembly factor BamA
VIAAVLVAVLCQADVASGSSRTDSPVQQEKIAEIRVHGNATITDDAVINLAGIAVGAALDPSGLDAVEKRLKDSGRFDEVQVRKRYRTLAMDEVSIILLVHERPGVTAAGNPPSPFRRLRSHLMYFPILRYDDGYGWTYGGRASVVNALGKGTRLSFPLSWGGTKRAALEADRTFTTGPLTRLSGSFDVAQEENPHYMLDDRRTEGRARAERRLFNMLTFGGGLGRTRIRFGSLHEQFWTGGADVTIDTARDPMYPSDAVLASITWSRLNAIGPTSFGASGASIDRYELNASGFKRLFRQNVLAVRAEYDTASAPLPLYEQWLLGGTTLRGVSSKAYAGDKRLLWSAEVRVPVSSALNTARIGFSVFTDGGAIAAYGARIGDVPHYTSAGAGLWIIATVVQLNFDVARSLDGQGTRFHFGTGFTF